MATVSRFDMVILFLKVHANAVLVHASFWSQLVLLHLCLQLSLTEAGGWRSQRTIQWLRAHGCASVPKTIKGELIQRAHEQWVEEAEAAVTAPPLLCHCPVGQIGNELPRVSHELFCRVCLSAKCLISTGGC